MNYKLMLRKKPLAMTNYLQVRNISYKLKILLILLIATLSTMLAGCINLKAKNIPQKQYSFSIETPNLGVSHKCVVKKTTAKCDTKPNFKEANLALYPPQIAPQFSGLSFVYRTNEINYTTDHYSVFFGFPAEQIQQNSIKYLQANKIFKYVSDNTFPLKTDYALKTNILELYADYRDPQAPKAVISIQYVLFDVKEQPTILFNKTFNENVPLAAKSSDALIDGWNKGLQKILRRLTYKIAG